MQLHPALTRLPSFEARMNALDDFEAFEANRYQARLEARWKGPGWRWSHRIMMRRAMRAWERYAQQIRSVQ